jgi:hypothetical protein
MTNEEGKEMEYCGRRSWGWKLLFIPPMIAVALLGVGYIVMLLWNEIVPGLFPSVAAITFWHAVGLLILCKILFGGFRKGGHRGGWRGKRQMMAWKQKWAGMSEEEKAKFKEEWKNRCGGR